MTQISAESSGETVGEAKWAALRELERLHPGLDKSSVRFQVVSEGERGLLGVGYEPARVVASLEGESTAAVVSEPAAALDEGDDAALMRELVTRVAAEIGVQCSIEIDENEDELRVTCAGRELGLLIGRHGQTIDAIQQLAYAVLSRSREDRKRVVVDAAGYRARRQSVLDAIALQAAEQAAATGRRVALESMSAGERRIVHERLKDDPEVETLSEGMEPNRFVVVVPRHVAV